MTDTPTTETPEAPPASREPYWNAQRRRPFIILGMLVIAWALVGQIAQRTAPPLALPEPTKTPAPSVSTESPAEAPAAPITEVEKPAAAPVIPPAASAKPEEITALEARINALEAQLATIKQGNTAALGTLSLLSAYEQLREVVIAGKPYTQAHADMAAAGANNAAVMEKLRMLEPYKSLGIPTLSQLQREFEAASAQAVTAQFPADSFMAQLQKNLSSLITIRRIHGAPEGSVDAAINTAAAALQAGDVTGASAAISTLKEPVRAAFEAWLAHSDAYLAREGALSSLKQALLAP